MSIGEHVNYAKTQIHYNLQHIAKYWKSKQEELGSSLPPSGSTPVCVSKADLFQEPCIAAVTNNVYIPIV